MYIIYIQVLKILQRNHVGLFFFLDISKFFNSSGTFKIFIQRKMYKFYKKCSFIQVFSCNASYFLAKSSERLVVEVGNLSILGKLFLPKIRAIYFIYLQNKLLKTNKLHGCYCFESLLRYKYM